ncbi:MAG TPA: cytochrome c peroxidase [Leptospiraceae bacterium]|nr:cytochrome c peroxidase [Leptospiraceae bacterium]HMW07900.1 cytochrome c peroxidase [Leptospiraceae bacterium]HMX33761.1 cytochrome c peroxidase [Leptospiraceae bacterium]HMY31163.1 cytochrome c peroxidase [Leptospiraceae bacterium]HMZ65416.1 cytochrome c peroxidase [Leptospiraceae bacterium]
MKEKILFILFCLLIASCGPNERIKALVRNANEIFGVIPDKMPGSENDTLAIINLGRKLYFDNRLSVNDNQSCNTCHNVLNKRAGVDNLNFSPGVFGKNGNRNTPTVLNAGFQIAQFWDGRAKKLEDQTRIPLFNPLQMAIPDERYLVDKIASIPEYKDLFEKAYGDKSGKITFDQITNSISAFQRTFKTNDRFDDFQRGKYKALNPEEIRGLEIFLSVGCANCHKGPLLGGNSFQKLGVKKQYENKEDLGRTKVTGKEEDLFVFKVPMLRNVALTAPYFHDGSINTLDLAVKKMADIQLGKSLSEQEIEYIVAFLNALTDKSREN